MGASRERADLPRADHCRCHTDDIPIGIPIQRAWGGVKTKLFPSIGHGSKARPSARARYVRVPIDQGVGPTCVLAYSGKTLGAVHITRSLMMTARAWSQAHKAIASGILMPMSSSSCFPGRSLVLRAYKLPTIWLIKSIKAGLKEWGPAQGVRLGDLW